jgi:PIN domain nuclease of toxin-antitoxin system
MRYLLDTHVFVWSILETKKIPKKTINEIKDPNNEIFVSSVSLWEISIKTRIHKLELTGIAIEDLASLIEKMDFRVLDMTREDSIGYCNLSESTHKDPFDRMLIWQCIRRNLTMISKDSEFQKFVPFGLKIQWK